VLACVAQHYQHAKAQRDDCDGLSLDFAEWRFNLRASNTEPLLRLNVETRANVALLADKTDELLTLIAAHGNDKETL
jgi:phosphomannomutase (EC 5.4.2.8)